MAFDTAEEAAEVAKAEVRGAGLPTPVLEKQIEIEKAGHVPSLADTKDSTPTKKEIYTLRRVPRRMNDLHIMAPRQFVILYHRFPGLSF